jgi:hypothetical protein
MGGAKDNEEYYQLLGEYSTLGLLNLQRMLRIVLRVSWCPGVPKDSTETEIRRAYRRLAVKMHPDKVSQFIMTNVSGVSPGRNHCSATDAPLPFTCSMSLNPPLTRPCHFHGPTGW